MCLTSRIDTNGRGGGKGCEVASRTFLLRLPAASTWPLLGALRLESVYLDGDAAAPRHFKTIIYLGHDFCRR